MMKLPENIRRALGVAVQILEELPEELRPVSNIQDMKGLLEGHSSGRDGLIITEAIAVALAYLSQRTIANPPIFDGTNEELFTKIYNTRLDEFTALFDLVRQIDAFTFTASYLQTCVRIGMTRSNLQRG